MEDPTMTLKKAILAATLSLGLFAPALAATPTVEQRAAAMRFATTQMGLPMPAQLPPIQSRNPDDLRSAVVRTGPLAAAAQRHPLVYGAEQDGVITLWAAWDPSVLLDFSILVHESVHVAQDAHPGRGKCEEELDAEAFRIQDAWLRAHGSTLGDVGLAPRVLKGGKLCGARVFDFRADRVSAVTHILP
jgi:hypothetical protein